MNKENCALKLVNEIILYYDARSKKHQLNKVYLLVYNINIKKVGDSVIKKGKCGLRIVQELSHCLFTVCFNNSINC